MPQILKINAISLPLLSLLFSLLLSCGQTEDAPVELNDNNETSAVTVESITPEDNTESATLDFTTIEWIDLIPEDDLDALLNPPEYIDSIEEGSGDDSISGQLDNNLPVFPDTEQAGRYQQALSSARVISEMDGKAIRIPGFVVPIGFGEDASITQFFLVPYFGACIHLPPPPPNQIIYVNYPQGFKPEAIYDPFWISGVIEVKSNGNDKATAAYTMTMHALEPYTEQ